MATTTMRDDSSSSSVPMTTTTTTSRRRRDRQAGWADELAPPPIFEVPLSSPPALEELPPLLRGPPPLPAVDDWMPTQMADPAGGVPPPDWGVPQPTTYWARTGAGMMPVGGINDQYLAVQQLSSYPFHVQKVVLQAATALEYQLRVQFEVRSNACLPVHSRAARAGDLKATAREHGRQAGDDDRDEAAAARAVPPVPGRRAARVLDGVQAHAGAAQLRLYVEQQPAQKKCLSQKVQETAVIVLHQQHQPAGQQGALRIATTSSAPRSCTRPTLARAHASHRARAT